MRLVTGLLNEKLLEVVDIFPSFFQIYFYWKHQVKVKLLIKINGIKFKA